MKIKPIFILGAPRSGTTLLASMLASRNDVIALPEMHYIHNLLRDEILFGNLDKKYIFDTIKKHFMFLDLDIAKNDEEIMSLIGETFKETVLNILERYNQKYYSKNYKYWVEHSPHNHYFFSILRYYFPNAMFIHIVRDGRAVYSSTIEQIWGYKDIITGAITWKQNVEECLLVSKINSEKVFTIKYEDLTSEPEKSIKKICTYFDMDFKKSMLNSKGLILAKFGKKKSKQSRTMARPNTKSHNKWKSRLKRFEIEHFTNVNERLLEYFGYEVDKYFGKEIKGFRRRSHLIIGKLKFMYFRRKFKKIRNKSVGLR